MLGSTPGMRAVRCEDQGQQHSARGHSAIGGDKDRTDVEENGMHCEGYGSVRC